MASIATLKDIEDRCDIDGSCWLWQQSVNNVGYPQCSCMGKGGVMVRRLALIFSGKAPKQGHKSRAVDICGNKTCCNPKHLRWNGFSQILERSYKAGARRGINAYIARFKAAKKAGLAKLNEESVREIRATLARGGERHEDIAKRYGVSVYAIGAINTGRSWRHVTLGGALMPC